MIYEMRVYEHADGRADAVRKRFETEVAPRLPAHEIDLVGVFTDAETGMLTYITRFADEAARKRGWASFGDDAGWRAAKAASEKDGPLVVRQRVSVLEDPLPGLPLG